MGNLWESQTRIREIYLDMQRSHFPHVTIRFDNRCDEFGGRGDRWQQFLQVRGDRITTYLIDIASWRPRDRQECKYLWTPLINYATVVIRVVPRLIPVPEMPPILPKMPASTQVYALIRYHVIYRARNYPTTFQQHPVQAACVTSSTCQQTYICYLCVFFSYEWPSN